MNSKKLKNPTTKNDLGHNLCNSCTNIGCEFQSGIVRTECAFYMPPRLEKTRMVEIIDFNEIAEMMELDNDIELKHQWEHFYDTLHVFGLKIFKESENKGMTAYKPLTPSLRQGMNEQMEFSETFERFAKKYGFKDDKEAYTNGSDLIPIFRVKQWLEHDNKLRAIETDTAYECGKHANKWIPVSERLPEDSGEYLVSVIDEYDGNYEAVRIAWFAHKKDYDIKESEWRELGIDETVIAWMPLPKPYKAESEEV